MLAAVLVNASGLDTFINWFKDPESLLVAMGPWVLWGTMLIVLIESGVLFPVLPGESLLFTAGLLKVGTQVLQAGCSSLEDRALGKGRAILP